MFEQVLQALHPCCMCAVPYGTCTKDVLHRTAYFMYSSGFLDLRAAIRAVLFRLNQCTCCTVRPGWLKKQVHVPARADARIK
jgi:hypothetical protein